MHRYLYLLASTSVLPVENQFSVPYFASTKASGSPLAGFRWQFLIRWSFVLGWSPGYCNRGVRVGYSVRDRFPLLPKAVPRTR